MHKYFQPFYSAYFCGRKYVVEHIITGLVKYIRLTRCILGKLNKI